MTEKRRIANTRLYFLLLPFHQHFIFLLLQLLFSFFSFFFSYFSSRPNRAVASLVSIRERRGYRATYDCHFQGKEKNTDINLFMYQYACGILEHYSRCNRYVLQSNYSSNGGSIVFSLFSTYSTPPTLLDSTHSPRLHPLSSTPPTLLDSTHSPRLHPPTLLDSTHPPVPFSNYDCATRWGMTCVKIVLLCK